MRKATPASGKRSWKRRCRTVEDIHRPQAPAPQKIRLFRHALRWDGHAVHPKRRKVRHARGHCALFRAQDVRHEGRQRLQVLSQNGAEPNAFTSNAMTGYYFDCTEHFEENLRILLSFVSVPYFTDESVEKERGIIGQEIRMVEDSPDWQVYERLLACLYRSSPARRRHRRHGPRRRSRANHGGNAVPTATTRSTVRPIWRCALLATSIPMR